MKVFHPDVPTAIYLSDDIPQFIRETMLIKQIRQAEKREDSAGAGAGQESTRLIGTLVGRRMGGIYYEGNPDNTYLRAT